MNNSLLRKAVGIVACIAIMGCLISNLSAQANATAKNPFAEGTNTSNFGPLISNRSTNSNSVQKGSTLSAQTNDAADEYLKYTHEAYKKNPPKNEEKNPKMSAKSDEEKFIKSAEQGDAEEQYFLGLSYQGGDVVPKDMTKAVKWYTKAAERGYANAQNKLGGCYERGLGVPKDLKKAVEWYSKAAAQKNGDGLFYLGNCYANGIGVQEDEKKAVELFTKSAEQGSTNGQLALGICYEYGELIPKDMNKAVELYKKAAEHGDEDAQARLKAIGGARSGNPTVLSLNEQIVQWEQGEKDARNKLYNSYIDSPKGKVYAPQGFFEMFHPLGKAKSIVVHDVKLEVDEKDFKRGKFTPVKEYIRFTIYWEGPVEKSGYTKLQQTFDLESRKTIGWKILSTNGMTTGEATEAGAAIGVTIHELFK